MLSFGGREANQAERTAVTDFISRFSQQAETLRFPEIRYWGEFTIVRDPGAPILFLGYFLGLAGLLLKLPGRRAEVRWASSTAGGAGVLRGWGGPPLEGPSGSAYKETSDEGGY